LLILPFVFANAEEHAPVGERQLSTDELVQQSQVMESEEMPPVSSTDPVSEEVAGYFWDGGYVTYYPISCHFIYAISAFQDSIVIEDGSIWQIDSYEAFRIRDWLTNDAIVITQNLDWFSSYKYKIVNKNLGSSVAVNLSRGPILAGAVGGEYTRYIAALDYDAGIVILSDQSRWTISSRDRFVLNKWAINDYIITGVNTGWDSKCPHILINSNMDNFIRAKQI